MARNSDDLEDSFATDEHGGWLARMLADDEEFDGRTKWRLASWAVGSLGALVIAILASQSSLERRRDQVAAADLARQSQQLQRLARDSQSEATRLAAAIETLNADRDRLYTRLGSLEQNLDSVTGSIAKVQASPKSQAASDKAIAASLPEIPIKEAPPSVANVMSKASAPQAAGYAPASVPAPAKRAAEATPLGASAESSTPSAAQPPAAAPQAVAAAPLSDPTESKLEPKGAEKPGLGAIASMPPRTQPLMASRSMLAPPDAGASKLSVPAATAAPAAQDAEPEPDAPDEKPVAVPRTSFGVELGGANSVDGLRALWRRVAKAHKELNELRPIIMVKENAAGGQLRLVAGPLDNAAAAARLCATLGSADRSCETTLFDGQRLPLASTAPPRHSRKRPPKLTAAPAEAPAAAEVPSPPPQPKPGPLSSLLGLR
ncbi:SPOR domain-containing protein [Rhodopseudomonas sp. HC1]|uniref:SPOR domain-containing protein n=1 Tax=Rhodopseudomonas infernalis TaxID=2897386 RepID=UPI001EE97761|nr:SPOR domain-containing protein [Rhodopseudomonas infernalis]MCG6204294.1 SPOR domain-containing protein [Rhodopseudomonas infernalis]